MPAAVPIAAGIATGVGASAAGIGTTMAVGLGVAAAAATGVGQHRAEKKAKAQYSAAEQEAQRQQRIAQVKEIHQNVLNVIQDPNAPEYQEYFAYYQEHREDVAGNQAKSEEILKKFNERKEKERQIVEQATEIIADRQDKAIQNLSWLIKDLSKTVSDTYSQVQQLRSGAKTEQQKQQVITPVEQQKTNVVLFLGIIIAGIVLALLISQRRRK